MQQRDLTSIAKFIELRRFPLTSEKRAQDLLAAEFQASGIPFDREVRLGDGDIIDFLVDDVGVEMKLQGQRRAIFRQCERYCSHDRIGSLLLATAVSMGIPAEINGKPVRIASLSRAWL